MVFVPAVSSLRTKTMSLAVHPGMVDTPMTRKTTPVVSFVERIVHTVAPFMAQSPEEGAASQLYAATAPEVKGDEFYGPRFYLRGYPRRQKASRSSYNQETAARLWKISEELTGIHYTQLNGKGNKA
jgi:NAD(P)-dependent dehydrogenase (short-subunit alcohol dehydrogenase family)